MVTFLEPRPSGCTTWKIKKQYAQCNKINTKLKYLLDSSCQPIKTLLPPPPPEMFIFSSFTALNILVTSPSLYFIHTWQQQLPADVRGHYLCRSRFCHLHIGNVFVPLCRHQQKEDIYTAHHKQM